MRFLSKNYHNQRPIRRFNTRRVTLTFGLIFVLLSSLFIFRPASAAIALRGTATTGENGTGSTTLTINKPASTVAGDVMVMLVSSRGGTGVTFTATGWTPINSTDSTTNLKSSLYYRVAGSSEGSSYNVTLSASQKASGIIISYSGVDTANPIDTSGVNAYTSSSTMTAPTITTTQPNTMLVAFYSIATSSTFTQGSSMTERADVTSSGGGSGSSKVASGAQDVAQAVAGATGTKNMTATGSAVNIGHLIALRESPGISQAAYRFFQNTDSTTASTPYAAKNTAATINKDVPFRLRVNLGVANGGSNMTAVATRTFKLQYATKSGTCGTYADVTTSTVVRFYNNATPTDGAAYVADAPNDPSRVGITVVGQKYHEANPLSMAMNTPANQDALWDVALTTNGANYGDVYCFRAIHSDGAVLNGGYTVTPEFTIATPTVTQANYRWFAGADSASPGSPLVAQDTSTSVAVDTPFRLRQRLAVDVGQIAVSEQNYKLQYAEKSGVCDVGFSGETYTDVNSITNSSHSMRNAMSNVSQLSGSDPNSWTNINNVSTDTDGGQYVSTVFNNDGATRTLRVTGDVAGQIPADATITGFSVDTVGYEEVGGGTPVITARLVIDGTQKGDSRDITNISEGSSTDLWGATWTANELNSSTSFGVDLYANLEFGIPSPEIHLDHIYVEVYYSETNSGGDLQYHNNSTPTSGTTISSSGNDPTNGARSAVYQTYNETDPFTNSVAAIPVGNDGIWDFAFTADPSAAGKTYCIRTVKENGDLLDSYSNIPEITITAAGPTLDQMMRGGGGVLNGVKQNLTW